MAAAEVQRLAMALIDDGQVAFVRARGYRNVAAKLPLQTDTIMYGASLTRFAFTYMGARYRSARRRLRGLLQCPCRALRSFSSGPIEPRAKRAGLVEEPRGRTHLFRACRLAGSLESQA
jgi:hypothetical protein